MSASLRGRLVTVTLVVGSVIAALSAPARADTAGSPDTITTAAIFPAAPSIAPPGPFNNAVEGTTISIHVHHDTVNRLNSVQARLCKPDLDVVTPSQLAPTQFGNCIPAAFVAGSDDATTNALSDADKQNVDLSFRVGTGTQTFTANNGPSTITCDGNHPCDLWLDQSVSTAIASSGHIFKHYRVNYDASTTPPEYIALTPARILETRAGQTPDPADGLEGAIGPDGTIEFNVLNVGGVPSTGVSAVVLNVTATETTDWSYFTVYPGAGTLPGASSLNFAAGQTVANNVIAKVGTNGKVAIFNKFGSAQAIADVVGYFPATSPYVPLAPARILETRAGQIPDPADGLEGAIGPDGTIEFNVLNVGGVPSTGVSAVVLNITATETTDWGYFTVYPGAGTLPGSSSLNFTGGQTVANNVIAKVGTNGKVAVFNKFGSAQAIADVVGYFPATSTYVPLTPARILETRAGQTPDPADGLEGAIGPDGTIEFNVLNIGGVPSTGVGAVVLNITATETTDWSFFTVFPGAGSLPGSSSLNFAAGQTVANNVIAKVGTNGKVAIFNKFGSAQAIADVVGYFPG
ncbi:MAG TPA: hypothetical protein VFB78_12105 [Acidimicrobiales bacterium]|nr:hypothetical protein [Acidimicrobiales bacterium]